MSGVFANKKWFAPKYAILSEACNNLIINDFQNQLTPPCLVALSLRRKGNAITA